MTAPIDKTPRFVVVELRDGAFSTAQEVARAIVHGIEDVKEARPAYSDGFGRLVQVGSAEAKEEQ